MNESNIAIQSLNEVAEVLHVTVFDENIIKQIESIDIKQTETNDSKNTHTIGIKLAPYNPTNVDACNIALDILSIDENDILYDLGCGDGRLLIEGCLRIPSLQAVGVEFDSSLCNRAIQNIKDKDLSNRAKIIHDNVLNIDISPASAIFIYLVPEGMKALAPTLIKALQNGTRIVTYVFSIPGLTPISTTLYKKSTKIYLYNINSIVDIKN